MKYIFIVNIVGDINVNTIHYKFDQTLTSLASTNLIIVFFGRREYIIMIKYGRYAILDDSLFVAR